ncbi:MAG: hypothetical protein ABS70_04025 [Nitrospira sp. SCN 59-13]|nr:MAG: hypothetical protein ABS70_04025 [Nitrospira sp. SCN 59-13]
MEQTRANMIEKPTLSLSESLSPERRTAFYERHKSIAVLMILIVFLLPFAGLFVYGLVGAVASVMISVLGYYFTPYLMTRVSMRTGP